MNNIKTYKPNSSSRRVTSRRVGAVIGTVIGVIILMMLFIAISPRIFVWLVDTDGRAYRPSEWEPTRR